MNTTVDSAMDILDVNPEQVTYESNGLDLDDDLGLDNDDLFDGLTEEDLLVPEEIVFADQEVVSAKVIDFRKMKDMGYSCDLKILSGQHNGKLFEMTMWKPKDDDFKSRKVAYKQFILSIFTKEEIIGKTATPEIAMGRCISFTALKAREGKNGKIYQSFTNYAPTKEEQANTAGL